MKSKFISPFKPKQIKDFNPKNMQIYTFNAGFKKKELDLLIIKFKRPVPISVVYSKTSTPSGPIIWDKINNKGFCKILIVNSGNANAHTGNKGLKRIDDYTDLASKIFKCEKNQILVSSTGVIGEQLDSSKICKKLNLVSNSSPKKILSAARSIMTTDTFPKIAIEKIIDNKNKISIYGIAKGSGMIAPNMGTMLAYIFIETALSKNILKKLLKENIDSTFNSITVDGDTSTNDTVALFATGEKKIKDKISKRSILKISTALHKVMTKLSYNIVTDGEGISKLIEINVLNAKTKNQANRVAFSIGESMLVKTAVAGSDANWGRIVMAIGKADRYIVQNKIIIKFDKFIVSKNGYKNPKINNSKLNQYMKNRIIKIEVNLNLGKHNKKVLSSDLTHDYININADYRS